MDRLGLGSGVEMGGPLTVTVLNKGGFLIFADRTLIFIFENISCRRVIASFQEPYIFSFHSQLIKYRR